jgi:hypothetical protein
MPQPPQLGAETRARIAQLLPQALEASLESYHKFVTTGIDPQATKDFAAHHTAAKVALAHINLLMKLASMIDVPGGDSAGSDLTLLLNKAMIELGQFTEAEYVEEEADE